MRRFSGWLQWANLALLAVLVYLVVDGFPSILRWKQAREQQPPPKPAFYDWVDPAKGMQLIMFYAAPGAIEKGDSANLCYGVAQAKEVRLDPPVANVWPSLNRCVSVQPPATTTYKLTAIDGRGQELSESLTIQVAPRGSIHAVESVASPLGISYFRLQDTIQEPDGSVVYSLTFRVTSAELVSIEPEVFPPSRLLMGNFYVRRKGPTTYKLTAHAGGKSVTRELALP